MIPRTTADAPVMPDSQPLRAVVSPAMGPPRTRNMRPEATMEASSGMITTGIRPRSHLGTCHVPIRCAM